MLHLATALGHGGAEIWLLNLIEPLRELGVDVGFVLKAPEFGTLEGVARERGVPIHIIRLDPTMVRYAARVARVAREGSYQIVHTHEFVHSAVGVAAAKFAHLPSMVTFHHYTYEAQSPLTRRWGVRQVREAYGRLSVAYTVRNATRTTTMSKAVMARVVPDWAARSSCRILRLSVEGRPRATPEERRSVRSELGLPLDARIVMHVGRFIEQKNHAAVLRVFREASRHDDRARLILMGRGPLEAEIRAGGADLVRSGRAQFLGLRNDVTRLMAASDALLFPSRDEGFGLVALEASACGLPVVATRVPGLDEALVDGTTALMHDLDDESGMVRSLQTILSDPVLASTIGAAGQRFAETFSHRHSAEVLAAEYRSMLTR